MIFKEEIALRPQGSRQQRSQEGFDSRAQSVIQWRFDKPTHNAPRAEIQSQVLTASASDQVSNWIEEIKAVWSRGGIQTMELARLVSTARERMDYGEWSEFWKSGDMPFSKRKGEMLVVIGGRMGERDAQTFAHLPTGWSILYWLARLDREILDRLIKEGTVHPKLRLQDAKRLALKPWSRSGKRPARKTSVTRRLKLFRDFVQRTLGDWKPAERELAKRELRRLIGVIVAVEGDDVGRELVHGSVDPPLSRRIVSDAPRVVTSLTLNTRKTV